MAPIKIAVLLALSLLAPLAGATNVKVQVLKPQGAPLADAVVFLESAAASLAVRPADKMEVAQSGKQFAPTVTVVPLGTAVHFPNRDTVRHHVYSFSPAKTFELKLYAGTPANPVLFNKPGIVVLGCNIHDHMAAWVVVVDTPYFGKTDGNGDIVLSNVPPGRYHLRAWHTTLPVGDSPLDQAITVDASDYLGRVVLSGANP